MVAVPRDRCDNTPLPMDALRLLATERLPRELRSLFEVHSDGIGGSIEVEARLGSMTERGRFQPGVTAEYFDAMLGALRASCGHHGLVPQGMETSVDVCFAGGVRVRCEARAGGPPSGTLAAQSAMRKTKLEARTFPVEQQYALRVGFAREESVPDTEAGPHLASASAQLEWAAAFRAAFQRSLEEVVPKERVLLDMHNCYHERNTRDPLLAFAAKRGGYLPLEVATQIRWASGKPQAVRDLRGGSVSLHRVPDASPLPIVALPGEVDIPGYGRHCFPACWYSARIGANYVERRAPPRPAPPRPGPLTPTLFRRKRRLSFVSPWRRVDMTQVQEANSLLDLDMAEVKHEIEYELGGGFPSAELALHLLAADAAALLYGRPVVPPPRLEVEDGAAPTAPGGTAVAAVAGGSDAGDEGQGIGAGRRAGGAGQVVAAVASAITGGRAPGVRGPVKRRRPDGEGGKEG